MSNSSEISSINSLPRTFNFALSEFGFASNPAWIIALFAFEVPLHTSSSFSMTQMFAWYLDNSLAIALPTTPAPMIATSYIVLFSFFFENKKSKVKQSDSYRLAIPCSFLLVSLFDLLANHSTIWKDLQVVLHSLNKSILEFFAFHYFA